MEWKPAGITLYTEALSETLAQIRPKSTLLTEEKAIHLLNPSPGELLRIEESRKTRKQEIGQRFVVMIGPSESNDRLPFLRGKDAQGGACEHGGVLLNVRLG